MRFRTETDILARSFRSIAESEAELVQCIPAHPAAYKFARIAPASCVPLAASSTYGGRKQMMSMVFFGQTSSMIALIVERLD
jgi:hypothetical protein